MNSKVYLAALAALLLAATSACRSGADPADQGFAKPNIVIFLADDLGHGDLGGTGAKDISTPNLDALAAQGALFTQAYANAPVCSPTRAALLSGQYQQRTGVDRVIYVSEREAGLDPSVELLPRFLRDAGYATAIVGKWHLGYPKESFPTRFGFGFFMGFVAGNIDYFAHIDRQGNEDLWRGEEQVRDDRYMTDLIGEEATGFIDRHADGPFFLYVPFNAPHDPFQGPGDRDTAGDMAGADRKNRNRETYKAMVESMDHNVGRIMGHIKKAGLDERTAVFFFSDNGGLPVVASNAPFSGHKGSLWEGGIRTPLIARFPGRFPSGRTIDVPAIGMDLFATALDLAGAAHPSDRKLDGVSLLPVLEGLVESLSREALFFRYQAPQADEPQRAMIRKGWKYLRDASGEEYLFYLPDDPAEHNDRKGQERSRFDAMKRAWEEWEQDVMSEEVQRLPPRRRS